MSTQFQIDDKFSDTDRLVDAAFDLIRDGLIVLDDLHCIRRVNRAAEALTRWSESDAYGAHWSVVLRIATGGDHTVATLDASEPPPPGGHRVSLVVGDAVVCRVRMQTQAIESGRQGAPGGSVITLRNDESYAAPNSDPEHSQLGLNVQEQLLHFALESGQQGIWEWDVNADVFRRHGFWSPRMEAYDLGAEVSGADLMSRMHPDDAAYMRDLILNYLRGDVPSLEGEIRLRRVNGSYGYFMVRGRAPERDARGRVKRLIGTFTEITADKAQDRRLQIALENGRQGLWEWEPDDDRVHFSREWYALFGYREGSITSTREDIQRIMHPDDAAASYEAIMPMLKGERDDFQVEQRFRHRDGHYIAVLERGRVLERNANGRVTRVIGTHVDISSLKEAEARLIESRRFLETVIDTVPHSIFWKDTDSRYLGCNDHLAALLGLARPADIVGRSDYNLPWLELAEKFRADDRRLITGEEQKIVVERQITTAHGEAISFETTEVALRAPDGTVIGVLGVLQDITERLHREQQLRIVANALTSGQQARLLNALTKAAADLADAEYAFVALLNGDGTATVTACFPPKTPLDGLTYTLAGTGCDDTVRLTDCHMPTDMGVEYPDNHILREWNIRGYAGQRLSSADGDVIGIFGLLFTRPPSDSSRLRTVIDIFAARAAVELERERTHGELEASEQRLNAAIEGGDQGVWEWESGSDCMVAFGRHFRDLGYSDEKAIGTGAALADHLHPEDRAKALSEVRQYLGGHKPTYELESRLRRAHGSYHWTLIRGRAAAFDDAGRVTKMIGTHTDISAVKQTQAALERSQKFLELIIDTVPQGIFWQDRELRYLGCNEYFAELADFSDPDDLVGKTDDELWWSDDADRFKHQAQPLLNGDSSHFKLETPFVDRLGIHRWFEVTKVPIHDDDGAVIGILGAIYDISVLKHAEDEVQRLALYDPLTELPNRRYFSERLESSIAAAARRGTAGALLFIDMDQFKQINDTLGHSVGDALLQAVAARLQNVTRQEDVVARLGGDEFVVLLPDLAGDFEATAHQAQLVADKINESLGRPFQIEHHQFHITPTIGISLFPEPGKGVDDVLKEADTAMYSGKAAGRNVTRFFRREMEESAQQRLRIEEDLRHAVENDELEIYFQPQVNRKGRTIGAECLLRWHHPERGTVAPAQFIPIAEERGLIVEVGKWVFESAFATYNRWIRDRAIDIDELSINVSSRQLRDDAFVEDLERLLLTYRIPPHHLVLELTEGTVIEDIEATIVIMERLRRLGICFALDDFGVGYSPLSYLQRLPIDQLKIDRSFIADIGRDRNDEIICQTIVAMGRHLGLKTVAEGAETQAQFEFLQRLRCNSYQGFLFLPSSPEREFLNYCARTSISTQS